MKDLSELNVHVHDAGTFLPMAEMMARSAKHVTYYSPMDQEFLAVERCVIGDGLPTIERVDDYMDPEFFDSVDLWLFPDLGYIGFQKYLRSIGKLVWGSVGASNLEWYRTRFISVLHKVGLPVIHSEKLKGLTALAEHLKEVKDKWVKINRYRESMETWHHIDYLHSQRELERLALCFGPVKEEVVFVVQDAINGDESSPVMEIGYDGWCVDGGYPSASFSGYEGKNETYLGSLLDYKDLPEQVRVVNEAMTPILREMGYRNFWATEIRIKDDVPYFIDPTARTAGMTQEHLMETCTNLAEVIYQGSQGNLIKPEFSNPFAAEATIHYTADCEGWKTLRVPKEAERYVKLYRYCFADGAYQFPPHKSDELGVVIGNGDSVETAVEDLKANFELLKDEPVSIEVAGFAELIQQIEDAESEGVEFGDTSLPTPESVVV